jgi:hypothetical protein
VSTLGRNSVSSDGKRTEVYDNILRRWGSIRYKSGFGTQFLNFYISPSNTLKHSQTPNPEKRIYASQIQSIAGIRKSSW